MGHIDVLAVGCPLCLAQATKGCVEPKTQRTTRIHTERVKHAMAVARYRPADDIELVEDD